MWQWVAVRLTMKVLQNCHKSFFFRDSNGEPACKCRGTSRFTTSSENRTEVRDFMSRFAIITSSEGMPNIFLHIYWKTDTIRPGGWSVSGTTGVHSTMRARK